MKRALSLLLSLIILLSCGAASSAEQLTNATEAEFTLSENYNWAPDELSGDMVLYRHDFCASVLVPIYLAEGDYVSIEGGESGSYSFSYALASLNAARNRYEFFLKQDFTDLCDTTIDITSPCYFFITAAFSLPETEDRGDIDYSAEMTARHAAAVRNNIHIYRTHEAGEYENLYPERDIIDANTSTFSVSGYTITRINKTTSDGTRIIPRVDTTSSVIGPEGAFGTELTALMYSQIYHTGVTMNAALFNTDIIAPAGQTIVDGRVIKSSPMESDMGAAIDPDYECYPLIIDSEGHLDYAKQGSIAENKRYALPDRQADAFALAENGAVGAFTAWGVTILNNEIVLANYAGEMNNAGTITFEKVHGAKYNYEVQSIGESENYYYICSSLNSNIRLLAEFMLKYTRECGDPLLILYSCDGADSIQTAVGEKPVALDRLGNPNPVPVVLEFVLQQ